MSVPASTYRLQLTEQFGFDDACGRLDDIADLGVTHLYLSPVFEATPGSTHGYDIVDPTTIRRALGGMAGFRRLREASRARGLGVLIDIVPNHMAAHHANPWWWATLRDGAAGGDSAIFDIDWSGGRIVLPVLGDSLDEVLTRGEIRIIDGAAAYHDARFPLRRDAAADGDVGDVLARQHYELRCWRAGGRTYRRFFDIDQLVGVRVEDMAVFERTHALIGSMWNEDLIDGVRVDHVDGLARPGEYLSRLRRLLSDEDREAYIVVEKILSPGESLEPWPVEGTTGYDSLGAITRVFASDHDIDAMYRIACDAGADPTSFEDMVREARAEVLDSLFADELAFLVRRAAPDQASDVADAIRRACIELNRYRTYAADGGACDADDALALLVTGPERDNLFTQRLEQLTGPVMAKGQEDTAMYRWVAAPALCDVGVEPHGLSIEAFHQFMMRREASHSRSMNALSTHDTKRGEDARARLLAVMRRPREWRALMEKASGAVGEIEPRLSAEDLILLVSGAIAIWRDSDDVAERLRGYVVKAAREAKRRTSWIDPNAQYERSLAAAVDALLESDAGAAWRDAADALLRDSDAESITIAQTALHLTIPGVPDVYQGAERGCCTLVDPDNRRPVRAGPDEEWRERKARLVRRLLRLRRSAPELFTGYRPLAAPEGVIAFQRTELIVCAAVSSAGLGTQRLELEATGAWCDVVSGRSWPTPRIDAPWRDDPCLVLTRSENIEAPGA